MHRSMSLAASFQYPMTTSRTVTNHRPGHQKHRPPCLMVSPSTRDVVRPVVHAAGCSCYRLFMLPVVHAAGCSCCRLFMLPTTPDNSRLEKPIYLSTASDATESRLTC